MRRLQTIHFASFLVAATLLACVNTIRNPSDPTFRTLTISADEIARSGTSNAWDLLRARARRYDFYEDRYGRPRGIKTRRGRSTIAITDSDTPLILVDGARLNDFAALRDIPTDAIQSVELMSGIDGTVSQGTNAAAGVIYIHTWEASSA